MAKKTATKSPKKAPSKKKSAAVTLDPPAGTTDTTMKTKARNPIGQKIQKEFTFALNDKDVSKKASEAAKLVNEANKLQVQKDEMNELFKTRISDRRVRSDELLAVIHQKTEKRTVEVTMTKDFNSKLIQYWHQGQMLEERAMTPDETQMNLADANVSKRAKKQLTRTVLTQDQKRQKQHAQQAATQQGTDVAAVIKAETSRRSKRSAVDGVFAN
jgi:hypothetical protein